MNYINQRKKAMEKIKVSFEMTMKEYMKMIKKMNVTQSKSDFIRKAINAYRPQKITK